jgi:bifunctional UDP-N-acetylglucosamine pyrophosphorylase / glucosamine-1-phosphate N-acetyltransferase
MSPTRSALAVVLAAGEGTRMKSEIPKVLHEVAGRSMLGHVLARLSEADIPDVCVVVGPGQTQVLAQALQQVPHAQVFVQSERRGTAHAVLAAQDALAAHYDDVIVLFADTPLITSSTIIAMRAALAEGVGVVALGFVASNPFGYGRLVKDNVGRLTEIVEEKDATESQREINLCNAGLMAIDGRHALSLLKRINNRNVKKEFYLTDIVALARSEGLITQVVIADEVEVLGVNDRLQLAQAEAVAQSRLRRRAMAQGVTMIAPETVFLAEDTIIGRDVRLEPYIVIGQGVSIADGAIIYSYTHLEGVTIGAGAMIGPFARLRPGVNLADKVKVGNFVEIKNSSIAMGAKINHLSYVGDTDIGTKANIGAGVITCNYDGFFKYRTQIGAQAFIGSNSSLVAPVEIGDGAYVGSGSVVTKNVASDALVVARGQQKEIPGWAAKFRAAQANKKTK